MFPREGIFGDHKIEGKCAIPRKVNIVAMTNTMCFEMKWEALYKNKLL